MISVGCVAYNINNLHPLVVHAWMRCLNLNDSNLFRFIEGQTHFSTTWHAKMSLTRNEPI
jgi:hypothetical protein